MSSKAKEEHVVPEHLINVPLKPEHQLKIAARVNALKLFILNSVTDKEARKEVEDQLQELEDQCLKQIKENIAKYVKSKDFESRFGTQTSDKKESTGQKSLVES